jgi:hypothetical protein
MLAEHALPRHRLRLVASSPRPRRIEVRFHVIDGRAAYGQSRAFRLTHDDIEQLIGVALRLEAQPMTAPIAIAGLLRNGGEA